MPPIGSTKKKMEAIVIAIDIGKNSTQLDADGKTYFEKALFCASMIIKRKLLIESDDNIALILFGSDKTNNALSIHGSCFQNIELVVNLGVITWDILQFIENLSSTDVEPSDWLSALVVATDLLKNIDGINRFSNLQIVMFSNFTDNISLDKIDQITTGIQHLNIHLTMIGKDCNDITLDPILEKFITKTIATAVDFESVLPQLSNYKPKETSSRAWNVLLSFGNTFCLKLTGYKKIDEVPKKFRLHLCKNYDTPDSITQLRKQTSYYYVENGAQIEVDPNNIIDGYRFGDSIIPVSDIDLDAYGYKSGPRSLRVLGFTKAKNIQRSFLMDGGSYIFQPSLFEEHIIAFNALFKAMVEREEVMIVRKLYTANCLPYICAIFPHTDDDENSFVLVNLPYSEDEHLYKLPSLKSFKPNVEQKKAVCNFINAMDLNDNEDLLFMPEYTYNPELQFLYECIVKKALNDDKVLTRTLPPFIQSLLQPPEYLMEKVKQPISDMKKLFSFGTIINETNVKDNIFLKLELFNKEGVEEEEEGIKKPIIITAFSPIEDFNKLLEEGIDSEMVCQEFQNLTVNMIESSSSMEDLKKPVLNIKELRKFYLANNDANSYNNWMYHVKDAVLLSGKEEMWSDFIDSGIGLITNKEVRNSDVSQELSEEFMKHEAPEDITADFMIDDDDPLKEFL